MDRRGISSYKLAQQGDDGAMWKPPKSLRLRLKCIRVPCWHLQVMHLTQQQHGGDIALSFLGAKVSFQLLQGLAFKAQLKFSANPVSHLSSSPITQPVRTAPIPVSLIKIT